ncbi:hypothetical protein Tco_0958978 [Tanacetum coccineum]
MSSPDTDSEPLDAPSEAEETQPPSPTSAPSIPDYTSTTPYTNEELEPSEIPETRSTSPHSTTLPADSISPSSPHQPPHTQISPTHPRSFYYRSTAQIAVSDTKTESDESEDESTNSESEEAASEDQHQAVPVEDTAEGKPSCLGYMAAIRRALERAGDTIPSIFEDPVDGIVYMDIEGDIPSVYSPVQTSPLPVRTPTSPDWFLESPPASPIMPSPVATPAPAATLDEDDLLEVGAQLELHGSILHDHTECLDVLPPTLFEGYRQDLTELFARLGTVTDEIHS